MACAVDACDATLACAFTLTASLETSFCKLLSTKMKSGRVIWVWGCECAVILTLRLRIFGRIYLYYIGFVYGEKLLSNIKVDCTYDMLVIIESLDVVVFISVAL
jgi:hypothetical protein